MKKKGLIISTVVMVVVLIASLTTATYAWFNAANTVQVNDISLAVRAATNVNVGVKYKDIAGNTSDTGNYYKNTVMRDSESATNNNTVAWTGDEVGLGSTLTFDGLMLGGSKAIGTSDYGENWSTKNPVDGTTNILAQNTKGNDGKKYIVKAGAVSSTTTGNKTDVDYKDGSVQLAVANIDYMDATIGVSANQKGVKGFYAKVEVVTDGVDATLGVNAAIHFVVVTPDGKKATIEPFGATVKHNTVISSDNVKTVTGEGTNLSGNISVTGKVATSTFYFWIAKVADEQTEFKTDGTEIKDFRILAYIDGTDDACVIDAKGGCTIKISFGGSKDITGLGKQENNKEFASTDKFLTFA